MLETEITAIPPLTPAEQSIANCHSLLNVYHVLREELGQLGRELSGEPALLAASLAVCQRRIENLADAESALRDASHTAEVDAAIHQEIDFHAARLPRRMAEPAPAATRAQLDVLLWILSVRSREIVARAGAPTRATHHAVADLELDLQEFFRAMEQQSRGRYRFVFNLAVQEARDYYVDLRFEGARSSSIVMPAIFREVMRDLIANARKYTAPGGQIRVALHAGAAGLRCVIEDNGRGIPAGEITSVVEFGQRGSNVADVRTYGAGCGLTKAFLVTRQLGGRFWIASEVGRGTRIRLWLPPQDASASRIHALGE
jgi:signal transduction histidine kinase